MKRATADDKRIKKLKDAIHELLLAMEMQEKRETEEFHIKAEVARHIWDSAKRTAREALK